MLEQSWVEWLLGDSCRLRWKLFNLLTYSSTDKMLQGLV